MACMSGRCTASLKQARQTDQLILASGRITKLSPLTGKMTTYGQVYQHYAVQPSSLDPFTLRDQINQEYTTNQYDAFCNSVSILGYGISDIVIPEVYVAEDKAMQYSVGTRSLPIQLFVQILIVIIVLLYAVLIASSVIYLTWFAPKKDYWNEDLQQWQTWEQVASWKADHYWFVCKKDLAPFASKIDYPNYADVPQSLIDLYNNHCANAPDISPKNLPDWVTWIIIGAVAVGGIYIAVKVLPSYLRRKEK